MEQNWLNLLQGETQLEKIIETNQYTEKFGLALSEEDAKLIIQGRKNTLKEQRRVEFGEGIVPKIIFEFCDSEFIDQDNYVETILRLQDIFHQYKNEMLDEITDDELLHIIKGQFEHLCYGDLDYLENTCLSDFAKAIREGYDGYMVNDGNGEYDRFDSSTEWNDQLYQEVLRNLW